MDYEDKDVIPIGTHTGQRQRDGDVIPIGTHTSQRQRDGQYHTNTNKNL